MFLILEVHISFQCKQLSSSKLWQEK